MNKFFLKTQKAKNVIAIVGATASGKTNFSIELANEIGGEIISADSRIIYKGFDIGAAKPTKKEQLGIPHYMIDIVEPTFEYSAGLYKKQAMTIIEDILNRGKTPIIVGGTGLYIDILLKNYELPQVEPDVELRNKLNDLSKDELLDLINQLDPNAVEQFKINDRKKLIRSIEIIKSTNKALAQTRGIGHPQYNVKWIGKNHPRKILYKRIEDRVDVMIEQGLIGETKNLLNKYGPIKNIIDTIGYREIYGYLTNNYTLSEAIELLKKNTRNYAKRQLTWFRKNEEIEWDIYPEKLKK